MNENLENKGRFGKALRMAALSLAVVMVWQIVSPSMLRVIGALAEEGSALSRIYGILSENTDEPTTAQDYYELANISIGQRAYDKALGELEEARKLADAADKGLLAELHLKSASVYVIMSQKDKAKQHLDEAIALDGKYAQARMLRAQLAIENGESAAAAEDLKVYVEVVPEDQTMRLTLAQLQESINDFAGAKLQYDALYEAQKDQAHRLNALRCQFLAGEYDKALASFEKFITNQKPDSPYRPIAAFLRAACLMQLQRFAEAAKGFAEAEKYGYDTATCYDQMIACYFESENYAKVVESGEKLIKLETTILSPAAFYQKMGASLVQLERYEEALEYLGKSMEISPELAGNAYYRGVALLALKRYEEAAADFGKSIEQGFLTQFCYYNRGVCYVQLLNYDGAIEDMGMTLSSGEDEALIEAAKNILWQLAAYYESVQVTETATDAK